MDRLGRDYEMKRFDAFIPNQGFKTSQLDARKKLTAVLVI